MKHCWVIFTEWDHNQPQSWYWHLIGRFLKYHVYVMIECRQDAVVYVNSALPGVEIGILTRRFAERMLARADVAHVVEAFTNRGEPRFGWIGVLSCVTLTKRVLGVRKPWIITPTQLLRELNG